MEKNLKTIVVEYLDLFGIHLPDFFVDKMVGKIKLWALKQVGLDQKMDFTDTYGNVAARNGMREEVRKNIGNN